MTQCGACILLNQDIVVLSFGIVASPLSTTPKLSLGAEVIESIIVKLCVKPISLAEGFFHPPS